MSAMLGRSGSPRGGEQGGEAEESPSNKGAMRARGEEPLERARCAALVRTVVSATCKECGGSEYASTVVGALMQGVRWGINLRARSSALQCKECGGSSICEHGRQRSSARSAVGHQSASTVVSAMLQGVRWVRQSASTVVSALGARSAVGHQSASTVVSALSARSAVGHQSASTVVTPMQGVRWVCNLRARS